MRKWLARLSFPFFIAAFLLAWQGYKVMTGKAPGGAWPVGAYFVVAAVALGLGMAGVRERHRGENDE